MSIWKNIFKKHSNSWGQGEACMSLPDFENALDDLNMKYENSAFGEYLIASERTETKQFHPENVPMEIQHAIIGLTTETGEISDAAKKAIFYGQEFDVDNLKEEIGDLFWYMAIIFRHYEWDLDEILIQNIQKLQKRYPQKFTAFHAKERLDKK